MDRDDIYIDILYMYADGFHFMFIHTVNMQCFITYEVKKKSAYHLYWRPKIFEKNMSKSL